MMVVWRQRDDLKTRSLMARGLDLTEVSFHGHSILPRGLIAVHVWIRNHLVDRKKHYRNCLNQERVSRPLSNALDR